MDEKWRAGEPVLRIGEAYGEWKENRKPYEKVQGILIDTKYLMKLYARRSGGEIWKLAEKIAEGLPQNTRQF